ncbi:MAG TPA: tetratricopeptide repeat protein [Gemmatimonadaceae bacterium]|nr:tetratricopeptide repeat protein [Gemmatimonadaceae bacterium]
MRMRVSGLFSAGCAAVLLATTAAAQTPDARVAMASRTAPEPARDTAIAKLRTFVSRYPESPLRPQALFQLGELLVRRADAEFDAAQRAAGADTVAGDVPIRPEYEDAIRFYEDLVRNYPDFPRRDAAAYTLGTLYTRMQRHAEATRMFALVTERSGDTTRYGTEALFRLGDAHFEVAARERGDARRAAFARAAQAYQQAVRTAEPGSDLYFLSLYKLGWAYYNQASRTSQDEYRQAVEVFGRLVREYDRLTPERQAELGLRSESLDYMAIAFTQVGGAEAAQQYFASRDTAFKLPVLQRVAQSLRDQGDFVRAVDAYQAVIAEAPTDSLALAAQIEVVDIYQNRMLEPERAQEARLALVERFGPLSEWARANPGLLDEANAAREDALRQAGQYALNRAQQARRDRALYARAAELYGRYLAEYARSDSAQRVSFLHGEALFGQGEYARAGEAYVNAAYRYESGDPAIAETAGQNAIVALDSALVRSRTDRSAQDALFGAIDRYVAAFPQSETAKRALIQKGRRASETERWDVMADAFRTYAQRYPNDAFTPSAQKLIGDALYRQGQYGEAQAQWEQAGQVAAQTGRRALADSITRIRAAAATSFADTLVRQGEYRRAAEEVYVAYAERNPGDARSADALRNAIETYMLADSAARARGDESASREARSRAVELSRRLAQQYPTYQYRSQYQMLAARLLVEMGRREEAVDALREAIANAPAGEAKADAMVRLAVTLDTLRRHREAAEAYEQFATQFPRDTRAAGALYNAALAYREADAQGEAARVFGVFVQRFPRDERAGAARQARLELLRASGDTVAARTELAQLCRNPTADLRAECAARAGEQAFRQGQALFDDYQRVRLVIPSVQQLTAAGVQRASARKQSLLRTMNGHFTRAIQSGSPEWLAAATYYVGLAQWEYGRFLENVQLPSALNEEQRAAAQQGSAQQAEQNYEAARSTWRSLIEKAQTDGFSNVWVDRAREALAGNVPDTPPGGTE